MKINIGGMETEIFVASFLKFGKESDIYDLYNNGTIFMSPIQEFRKTEDNQLRGDKYEGVTQIWNFGPGQFEIESIGFKGNFQKMHLHENYEYVLGNTYSLYCISSFGFDNPNAIKIDKKMKGFGTHFLMITDCVQFEKRILDALKLTGFKFYYGFVSYYDKKAVNEQITLFQKPNEFEYQKEYRFYIERNELSPFSFKIGSLTDISIVLPIERIDEY